MRARFFLPDRCRPTAEPIARWGLALVASGTFLLGCDMALAAEGPVAAVQESLKRQQYYSGEVNGNFDEPTRGAVRRFQIRQGLKVTGDLDAATLEALAAGEKNLPPPGDAATPAPDPVPARERSRQTVREDREFLEQIEGSDTSSPNTTPPPPITRQAPPTEPPPPIAERSTSGETPSRSSERTSERSVTTTTTTESRPPTRSPEPPAPERRSSPPPEREREREREDSRIVSNQEARRAVESYLAAAEGETPERETSFYADQVNYFDSGRVNHDFIARDQKNYYRRWPQRQFSLEGEPEVVSSSGDTATVRFRIRYSLRRGDEAARGQTENVVRLQKTDDGLKIVSIRERKVRD